PCHPAAAHRPARGHRPRGGVPGQRRGRLHHRADPVCEWRPDDELRWRGRATVRAMATYVNGTPSWVDLGSPDPDASARFYGELFGWTTTEPGPVEETGGYRMFMKDGKLVAGLGPAQEGQPIVWTTYIAADDADKTAELIKSNGGMVFLD